MGLMNAIGLQPRNPAPSVTSQGTQTPIIQLQNAETQTERELPEPSTSQAALNMSTEAPSTSRAALGGVEAQSQSLDPASGESSAEGTSATATTGESSDLVSGEDALARIRRLIAEGGMTAVVQREQSTTMASMGGFGNNIIVSHRIHRGSQTATGQAPSTAGHAPSEPGHAPTASNTALCPADQTPSTSNSTQSVTASSSKLPFPQTDQSEAAWGPRSTLSLEDVFDRPSSSSLLLSSPSPPPSPSNSSSSSAQSPAHSAPPSPNSYSGDLYSR